MGRGATGNKVWGYLPRIGTFILFFNLVSLVSTPGALAKPEFFQQIPAGYEQSCNLCHGQPPVLNEFGQAFKNNGFNFAGLTNPSQPKVANPSKPDANIAGSPEKPKQPKVELILPGSVTRGEKTQLKARVTVGGEPVKGKQVQFFEQTELFVKGKMDLGKAATNAEGLAEISYWPRSEEQEVALVASAAGDAGTGAAEATASLALIQAGGPLVKPVEGLQVPFLGLWLVVLLVGAVWATYAYVVYNTLRIAKMGRLAEEEIPGQKEEQQYASF